MTSLRSNDDWLNEPDCETPDLTNWEALQRTFRVCKVYLEAEIIGKESGEVDAVVRVMRSHPDYFGPPVELQWDDDCGCYRSIHTKSIERALESACEEWDGFVGNVTPLPDMRPIDWSRADSEVAA